jgi:uncharacterized protein (DUF1810 family)
LRNALPIIAILIKTSDRTLRAPAQPVRRWHEDKNTVTIGLDAAQNDSYHLQRFVDAQATCMAEVLAELGAGKKRTHWMWFIFPQVGGLGSSAMAQRFAIASLNEAAAYLTHPLLGVRLRECTALVNAVQGRGVDEIFGYPDDLKFHSCITLFDRASSQLSAAAQPANQVFAEALGKYFAGKPDQATLDRLQ